MDQIPFINNDFMESHTDFNSLLKSLENGFAQASVETPMRHHHDYENPQEGIDSTLLLMPAWRAGKDMGVKVVTVSPNNGKFGLPAIQGTYLYMNSHNGSILAILFSESSAWTAKISTWIW